MSVLGLPPVQFVSGTSLFNSAPLPIPIVRPNTYTLPNAGVGTINLSGFNTLSLFATLANLPAANTLTITLVSIDPETGVAVVGSLGNLVLLTLSANGSYAATVYLPAYYASLTGLVLPFYLTQITLAHGGATAGTLNVTAFKLWLSNA